MDRRPTLVVMLKEPRSGRVKTRLGREIGMPSAAWWFRHQVARLLRRVEDPRWRLVLAVAPDRAVDTRAFPRRLARIQQGQGDLGARMARIMRRSPPGPVAIIGGDIPGVTARHIADAFAALGPTDAVFGPAEDGGYWLIALRRTHLPATLFANVRWSTEHALADSVASCRGLRIGYVSTLADVDTLADLRPPRR